MTFFMCPPMYISHGRYSYGIIEKKSKMDIWTQENPRRTHMRARAHIMRIYACFICPNVHFKNKINKNNEIDIKRSGHNEDASGRMDFLLS